MLVQLGGFMGDGRNTGFGTDMSEKSEDAPETGPGTGRADKKKVDEETGGRVDGPAVEKSPKTPLHEPQPGSDESLSNEAAKQAAGDNR